MCKVIQETAKYSKLFRNHWGNNKKHPVHGYSIALVEISRGKSRISIIWLHFMNASVQKHFPSKTTLAVGLLLIWSLPFTYLLSLFNLSSSSIKALQAFHDSIKPPFCLAASSPNLPASSLAGWAGGLRSSASLRSPSDRSGSYASPHSPPTKLDSQVGWKLWWRIIIIVRPYDISVWLIEWSSRIFEYSWCFFNISV